MQATAIDGNSSSCRKSRGELAYVVIQGCAIILGTFSGVLPDFGVCFGLFPDFWVSFFGKI